tara:strand:+ start:722 stop:1162 length:441 start_codon:yes stop_codon:yes gene_type:complete
MVYDAFDKLTDGDIVVTPSRNGKSWRTCTVRKGAYTAYLEDDSGEPALEVSKFRKPPFPIFDPDSPDFKKAVRAAKARGIIETLYYSKGRFHERDDLIDAILALEDTVGKDNIDAMKRNLRACGAGGNDVSHTVTVMTRLHESKEK